MQQNPDNTDYDQVSRIVNVEKPFHSLPLSAFAVIRGKDRDRQDREHLKDGVRSAQENEENGSIDRRPYNDV